MNLRKTLPLLSLLLTLAVLAGPAGAADYSVNTGQGMTLAGAPLAAHGYDVVAFFTEGEARLGSAEHSVAHGGGAYRFATKANLERFQKDPERYLPQYGGYCAYGVAVGAKFDGDPRVFAVVDGKLYFNLNPKIQETWEEDVKGNLAKAEANWPKIRAKAPAELK